MTHDDSLLEHLPPAKLLDTANTRVITPAIPMMSEIATIEQYLEHERANRNRAGIIHLLTERIDAIYEENDETPPSHEQDQEDGIVSDEQGSTTGPGPAVPAGAGESVETSPPNELLALVHEYGPAVSGGIAASAAPPAWDEL
jgi:hypothetical protein